MTEIENPGALAGATGVEMPSYAIAAGLPSIIKLHEKSYQPGVSHCLDQGSNIAAQCGSAITAGKKSPAIERRQSPGIVARKIGLVRLWSKLTLADRQAFLARLDYDLNFHPKGPEA